MRWYDLYLICLLIGGKNYEGKKRIFISLLLTVIILGAFSVVATATDTNSNARISYTYCETGVHSFLSEYNTHFNCTQADTMMSLEETNFAITAVEAARFNTFKETYVGIKNSSGKWKSDTQSNSSNNWESAQVNPLIFTPVYSQHDIIFYEPTIAEYKMHTRVYQ